MNTLATPQKYRIAQPAATHSPNRFLDVAEKLLVHLIPEPADGSGCVPFRELLQRIITQSKTTWFTLLSALYYAYLFALHVRQSDFNFVVPQGLNDPRRVFLVSLIVTHKFRYDCTYGNKAWAGLTGLSVAEITRLERAFLLIIDYRLNITEQENRRFSQWLFQVYLPGSVAQARPIPIRH